MCVSWKSVCIHFAIVNVRVCIYFGHFARGMHTWRCTPLSLLYPHLGLRCIAGWKWVDRFRRLHGADLRVFSTFRTPEEAEENALGLQQFFLELSRRSLDCGKPPVVPFVNVRGEGSVVHLCKYQCPRFVFAFERAGWRSSSTGCLPRGGCRIGAGLLVLLVHS